MRACRKRMYAYAYVYVYVYVYVRRYEQRRVEGENYCRIVTVEKNNKMGTGSSAMTVNARSLNA